MRNEAIFKGDEVIEDEVDGEKSTEG